jgi:predicted GH43/DUF377 family glycosyl hydrolase
MGNKFIWIKKGMIFERKEIFYWSQTHSALPTSWLINDDTLRIFYTSRDSSQRSRISYIDVNPENPNEILFINSNPILNLGEYGTFDDMGMTSSYVLSFKGKNYFYYNGYNIGTSARYRISIGLAIGTKDCHYFERISTGPIIDRSLYDPCGCATPFILFEYGIFRMWYSSFTRWEQINGEAEPFYRIAYAESLDAIHWIPKNRICIDLKDDEGGIVRPSVIKIDNAYYMWFSVRKRTGYRNQIKNTYRIGFAVSKDGLNWYRQDENAGIDLSQTGWDSEMICYPNVLRYKNKLYMFYNGNGFGQSGFGYAEIKLSNKN